MARIVSLVVLIAILLLVVGLFLKVMADFLLPLFLAVLLVVMFGPLYRWFLERFGGRRRVAAALTTAAILLMVLAPLSLLLFEAAREARAVVPKADESSTAAANMLNWAATKAVDVGNRFGMALDAKELEAGASERIKQLLAPMALRTTQFIGEAMFGLVVMVLATYYFFADGPVMVQAILRLSPLEGERTQELLTQFDSITRAVVVATLLSAFVQGLMAGVGFYFAGASSVFLLTALCMLLTLVPFVGAAIVWAPVCLWLYAMEGRTLAAVILAAYCICVVSTIDNLVKPLVLHGRSNLHPLLALLSVIGGAQALGPIGIFVGPMVVAFLQTLLNMVHAELMTINRPAAE